MTTPNIKMLGIVDDVHICDCCGKSNLKRAVGLDIDGDTVYYGVNCAATALGFTDKVYSARNATELKTKYDAREEFRAKKEKLIAEANKRFEETGKHHVVMRRHTNGKTDFSVCLEEIFWQRNVFGTSSIYTTKTDK